MGCFDELTYAIYADGELPEGETWLVKAHLGECQNCRELVAALEEENRSFVHAFQEIDVLDGHAKAALEYSMKKTAGELILAVLALAATFRAATAVITRVELPAVLEWLNPLGFSGQLNYLLTSIVYLIDEGGPMLMSLLNSLSFAAIIGLVCFGAFALLHRSTGIGAGTMLATIAVVAVFSSPGYAIDVRSSQGRPLTIASGETIDDTLIAVAESVIVDGTINGDLIAAARRVTINGRVLGDVISAGQLVEVTGTVEGNVFGFGQTVQVRGPLRNFYGFGQNVSVGSGNQLEGNATLFGQTLNVEGFIGRDVMAFGQTLEIRGNIGSDITFYGRNLTLLSPTSVGGNLTATVPSRELVVVSNGATVAGRTDIRIAEPEPSKYATLWFYIFQVIRLGAAFVTGLVLFWLVPELSRPDLNNRSDLLKAAGAGFLAAVATPVAAVLIGFTLIGLPVAAIVLVLWIFGLYLAKIVLAAFLGRALFPSDAPTVVMPLLAGLVLVIVAINLPYVGGLVNLLFTLIGLGVILLVAYRRSPWAPA